MFCCNLGLIMCWICGCADHVGLGNERETDSFQENKEGDIISK